MVYYLVSPFNLPVFPVFSPVVCEAMFLLKLVLASSFIYFNKPIHHTLTSTASLALFLLPYPPVLNFLSVTVSCKWLVMQLWRDRDVDRLVAKSSRSDDAMHIPVTLFKVGSWMSFRGRAKCITLQLYKKKYLWLTVKSIKQITSWMDRKRLLPQKVYQNMKNYDIFSTVTAGLF